MCVCARAQSDASLCGCHVLQKKKMCGCHVFQKIHKTKMSERGRTRVGKEGAHTAAPLTGTHTLNTN